MPQRFEIGCQNQVVTFLSNYIENNLQEAYTNLERFCKN